MNELSISNQQVYFKSAENMEEIPSESVTLVCTSPPYWNVRDYGGKQIGYGQSYQEYINSLNKVWFECIRILQPNGKFAINVQPLPLESRRSGYGRRVIQNIIWDIEKFMRKNHFYLSGMHYWDKSEFISNVSWGSYPKSTNIASNTSFEQIFVWVKPGKTRNVPKEDLAQSILLKEEWRHWAVRCIWDDISPVIKINSRGENRFGHSAPFPEDIPYRLIRMHTAFNEVVVDPFLGSGTTLKVCRLTGRKGIGYEINEEYRELIESRIKEDWGIPKIQPQYKVWGSEDFYKVIVGTMETVKINPDIHFDVLVSKLKQLLPEKMTISWTEHLKKKFQTEHKAKKMEKNKSLDKFLKID
ncbi:MAG: site-specific DNA-methyltransferase [Candidatus Heimdallarchaeota archaeon]|nr:site-specific DNA-methyltransferase [Candidatus Heimdallarchaeota archaeon]